MIVTIRGTSGSGKTHAARELMARLSGPTTTVLLGPRRAPGATVWEDHQLVVLGRYDTATCGGCDGQSWKGAADDQEALIRELHGDGYNVLLEGLMVSTWGVPRQLRLAEIARTHLTEGADPQDYVVLHLTTPLETCLASVQARRVAAALRRGAEADPLDPANTTAKYVGLERAVERQRAVGLRIERVDRSQVVERAAELLGV